MNGDTTAAPPADDCPGPLIWHDTTGGAVLRCATAGCTYLTVTGNLHDRRHAYTPLLREGLASR